MFRHIHHGPVSALDPLGGLRLAQQIVNFAHKNLRLEQLKHKAVNNAVKIVLMLSLPHNPSIQHLFPATTISSCGEERR